MFKFINTIGYIIMFIGISLTILAQIYVLNERSVQLNIPIVYVYATGVVLSFGSIPLITYR